MLLEPTQTLTLKSNIKRWINEATSQNFTSKQQETDLTEPLSEFYDWGSIKFEPFNGEMLISTQSSKQCLCSDKY